MPKITVIIPVYNVEKYLDECLDSVLRQTLKDIEVICVDDGSTDGSSAILARYGDGDSRIRVFGQTNSGAAVARNRALDEATGEFVVFMDPDDYYPDNAVLEKLYRAVSESGCDLAAGTVRRVPLDDPRAIKFNVGYVRTNAFPHAGVVAIDEYQSPFRYWCFIYRTRMLRDGGIRFPRWRRFQDPPFLARCLVKAGRFFAMEDVVYCYRLPEPGGSIDWNADGCLRLREFLGGFNELLDIAEENDCRKMYKSAADAFARAHRFDGLSPSHPLWRDVVAVLRRMRRREWLSFGNFENILRRMYGDEWGRGRLLLLVRLLGLRGGLSMWRYFRRKARNLRSRAPTL